MDPNDYSDWTARRPGAGFARATVDAMLAPEDALAPGDDGTVHEFGAHRPKIGAFTLLLAAALVTTAAVGMVGSRPTSARPVQSSLPVAAPPGVESAAPAPSPEVAMEAAEIEGRRPRPRPTVSAEPPSEPAPVVKRPEHVPYPRCDCLGDVTICACIAP